MWSYGAYPCQGLERKTMSLYTAKDSAYTRISMHAGIKSQSVRHRGAYIGMSTVSDFYERKGPSCCIGFLRDPETTSRIHLSPPSVEPSYSIYLSVPRVSILRAEQQELVSLRIQKERRGWVEHEVRIARPIQLRSMVAGRALVCNTSSQVFRVR